MLKQPCQTLSTNSACGSSFIQDHNLASQVTIKKTEILTLFGRVIAWVVMAFTVREERRVLAALTSQQLRDIGLNHDDVQIESQRSYWDVPFNRNARSEIYRSIKL
ncbi:MAG: DUF1127 domain-containing protein [Halopseudomonas aestusnigri]